jgi:hypothetical protein
MSAMNLRRLMVAPKAGCSVVSYQTSTLIGGETGIKIMPQCTANVAVGVINGRYQLEMRRPLFPRKQTWIGPARAGKLGEFQRFSPGGLFGLNSDFLRMNQDHRSASS